MSEWPLSEGGGIWNDIWKWVACEHADTGKELYIRETSLCTD